MSAFFPSQSRDDYWFRLGRFQMTSTLVVVLIGLVGLLASVFSGGRTAALAYDTGAVFSGEVWRIFTWPLGPEPRPLLFVALTLVMLWYFGRELEANIGRNSMAKLFIGIWVSLTVSALIIGVLLPGVFLSGLDLAQFAILLLFIAENPRRPFFFGIPAWVLGSVFLGIQVLGLIGAGAWGSLYVLLFGLFGVAIAAKRVGLLANASIIPGGTRPQGKSSRRAAAPRQPNRQEKRHVSDEDRMDALLSKISAEGIHSLTKGERAELEKLRQRRRR